MRNLILMTALVAALVGCSGGGDDNPVTNSQSGNCESSVVSDYNTMISNCNAAGSAYNCDNSINSFLNKYPGIDCKAEKPDPNSVDNQVVSITESNVRSLLSVSNADHKVHYKNGENCSGIVVDDYNFLVFLSCRSISSERPSISDYERCQSGIDKFLSKYPDVNCKYSASADVSFLTSSDLQDIRDALTKKLSNGDSKK